ncbi:MAG: hypothetical protein JWL66_2190 [Sphingomonadales bacterium]|nr:hypothetical protein [Sphingomonadales bacterium]
MKVMGGKTALMGRLSLATVVACTLSGHASAQSISTQVFDSNIPLTYDRGRNESVTDRDRPEYAATGIIAGGFTVLPSVTVAAGFTDNVYQTSTPKTSSAIATVSPKLVVQSNWSLNHLQLDAAGNFVRYLSQSSRNEDGWTVGGQGRIDLGADTALNLGARTSRLFETPFSGTGVPISRSALPVQATIFQAQTEMKLARTRFVLSADHSIYNYLPAQGLNGGTFTRDSFDRTINRGIGYAEYGLTPDAGVFVQGTYTDTNYGIPLSPGVANRDSSEVKGLAGATFDLTALLRGSIGFGYIKRSYDSPLYHDVRGFSFDGKIEYFPSKLTTVTLIARRDIEDSTLAGSSGYFDNGIALRADHEVLRNLIVNIGADYEHDVYSGIVANADIYRVSGGALYLLSRMLRLDANVGYRRRTTDTPILIGPNIDELRGTLGITVKL